MTDAAQQYDLLAGQISIRRLDELRPHPRYTKLQLSPSLPKLSALAARRGTAFQEPLVITREGIIVDGYARVQLARHERRLTLPCIEYELSEENALLFILQKQRRANGLNDFNRILLALELEPWFQEKAKSNQQAGGRNKGSSKLTEAEKVDVRSEIAAAADVCAANVTKVKQITANACSELMQALRNGEIRIHRAAAWAKLPRDQQREALWRYQSRKGINQEIRKLLLAHRAKPVLTQPDLKDLLSHLSELDSGKLASISVVPIKARVRVVFVPEELLGLLTVR